MSAIFDQANGERWHLYHGDCVEVAKSMPDNSVHFSIHSPPFMGLYIYSAHAADMGNSDDAETFYKQYGFLVEEMLRTTVPGRLAAVHCKDLPMYRNRDGACGLIDFPGEIVRLFTAKGWIFHSRVTLWKCPVVERERTNNNGLLHATIMRDSSQVRQGMADYLLVFRKNPLEDNLSAEPVARPSGITEWPGDPAFDPRVNSFHPSKYARKAKKNLAVRRKTVRTETVYENGVTSLEVETEEPGPDLRPSIAIWQRLADPVWWHIDMMDVLNYELGRDDKDCKHICPLQLGVIKEAVALWTNPGDVVYDPFNGIGSSGDQALRMHRKYIGSELKDSYYRQAIVNLQRAEEAALRPPTTLFDALDREQPVDVEAAA